MATKTKKIDKEYLITDSSVNCYGFRLLTSGYLIDEYKKNPIGYYMHDRDDGVVVRWEDLRVDGDKVYGKPVINLSNERGQQTCDEVENSFLNGASVGHIVAMEWSEEPSMMLPGQTGPTVTKWFNRECSLVDVPGNMNSLALYDKEGNLINLADFKSTNQSISIMKQLFLSPDQITKFLNLKADADQAAVNTALENLAAEAAKVPDLTSQLTTAQTAKKEAEDDLAALKASTTEKAVKDLVAGGITEKKITKEQGEKLEKKYADDPEGLKDLLATMNPYTPVTTQLSATGDAADKFKGDWDALDKAGKLENLKAENIELFKEKYKAKWNKEYAG